MPGAVSVRSLTEKSFVYSNSFRSTVLTACPMGGENRRLSITSTVGIAVGCASACLASASGGAGAAPGSALSSAFSSASMRSRSCSNCRRRASLSSVSPEAGRTAATSPRSNPPKSDRRHPMCDLPSFVPRTAPDDRAFLRRSASAGYNPFSKVPSMKTGHRDRAHRWKARAIAITILMTLGAGAGVLAPTAGAPGSLVFGPERPIGQAARNPSSPFLSIAPSGRLYAAWTEDDPNPGPSPGPRPTPLTAGTG